MTINSWSPIMLWSLVTPTVTLFLWSEIITNVTVSTQDDGIRGESKSRQISFYIINPTIKNVEIS